MEFSQIIPKMIIKPIIKVSSSTINILNNITSMDNIINL